MGKSNPFKRAALHSLNQGPELGPVALPTPLQMQEQAEAAELVAFLAEGADVVPFANQWDFPDDLKFIHWFTPYVPDILPQH